MAEEPTIKIKTGSDYWEFLKATAKEVQNWPDWKVGERQRSAPSSTSEREKKSCVDDARAYEFR